MRYVRLPFIYSYRPVNIKFAAFDAEDWMESWSPALQTEGNKSLANALASDVNKTLTKQRVRKPIPPRLQPGPAGTPLTRKEVRRMLNKALRKRPPGMGFGGGLMWAALGGLGGVLLARLLSSGGKKHEPSYYAPYIPGYRLY